MKIVEIPFKGIIPKFGIRQVSISRSCEIAWGRNNVRIEESTTQIIKYLRF
jgi:hypothetical protein